MTIQLVVMVLGSSSLTHEEMYQKAEGSANQQL